MTTPAYEQELIRLNNEQQPDSSAHISGIHILGVAAREVLEMKTAASVPNRAFADTMVKLLQPFVKLDPETGRWTGIAPVTGKFIQAEMPDIFKRFRDGIIGADELAHALNSVGTTSVALQQAGTIEPGQTVAHLAIRYVMEES